MPRFRLMTCFCLLALSISSHAQFSKGMRMLGVSIGSAFFNGGKTEYSAPPPTSGYTRSTNSLGISLSPSIGWFVSDATVIGVSLNGGYQYDKYLDAANNITFRKNEDRMFRLGLGVFARNYFKVPGSLLPFGQINLDGGFGSSSNEGYYYTSNYKDEYKGKSSGDFSANAGLTAGLTKMLNSHIGLDLTAGYTFSYSKNSFKVTTNTDIDIDGQFDTVSISDVTTKSTNHGFMIGLGVQVFLSKR